MYWALFVDTSAMEAWVDEFDDSEPPQQGCRSGQSYGSDETAARAALADLRKDGYTIYSSGNPN